MGSQTSIVRATVTTATASRADAIQFKYCEQAKQDAANNTASDGRIGKVEGEHCSGRSRFVEEKANCRGDYS